MFGAWSLEPGSELRGSDVYLHIVKKDPEMFLEIQSGYVPLDGLCLEFFSGFFLIFFKGTNHLQGINSISGLSYFL